MRLSISFKSNEIETEIYDYLQTKLSYSTYIKELILADMRRGGQQEPTPTKMATETNNDSMQIEW